uniref:mRNA guanylyltransferase n=2 Tax=Hirondellea gigas TaxID=1518452 RepID=A0A2P2HXK1_9CRUS
MSFHSNGDSPGPIPPRWLECPRKSDVLIDDKFLAFKTPLSTKFNESVPPANRFTPSMLFSTMNSYKVEIGMWIDLTNTNRFYDCQEVKSRDCHYVKLNCKGHGEAPSKDSVEAFISICSNFIAKCPTKKIGVHCTHGFNRTGFMICSFLAQIQECSVDFAIGEFAKARSPGIYKQDYINELYKRYAEDESPMTGPELPNWHTECDDTDQKDTASSSSGSSSSGSSSNGRKGKRGRETNISNPVFMEGVDKVYAVTEQPKLNTIRKRIQEMCHFNRSGFPGCQPVSMSRENLAMLQKNVYYVSWKADGTRYMMLIDGKGEVYFSDRDNSIFHAPDVEFKDKDDLHVNLKDTLLDGEMVIDTDPKTGQKYPRYLIYDAIRMRGKDVMQDTFWMRWERIIHDVIKPRNAAIVKGLIDKRKEPFSVRRKDFWEATAKNTSRLLGEDFCRQLAHEPDGLIFQPDHQEYVCGRCDEVLKWKPPTHNSVDFRVKVVIKTGMGLLTQKVCQLFVGKLEQPYSEMKFTKSMAQYDNKIIECKMNEQGQWTFMRERTDKSFPNSYITAQAVLQTIMHPVTQQYLLDFIHNYGCKKPDTEGMPPPQSPASSLQRHPAAPAASPPMRNSTQHSNNQSNSIAASRSNSHNSEPNSSSSHSDKRGNDSRASNDHSYNQYNYNMTKLSYSFQGIRYQENETNSGKGRSESMPDISSNGKQKSRSLSQDSSSDDDSADDLPSTKKQRLS